MLSLKILGGDLSLPLPSFWHLPAIFGVPWLIVTTVPSLPLSLHGFLASASVSVCIFTRFLTRTRHRI